MFCTPINRVLKESSSNTPMGVTDRQLYSLLCATVKHKNKINNSPQFIVLMMMIMREKNSLTGVKDRLNQSSNVLMVASVSGLRMEISLKILVSL